MKRVRVVRPQHDASDRAERICLAVQGLADALDVLGTWEREEERAR